jgi:hypothetical protein
MTRQMTAQLAVHPKGPRQGGPVRAGWRRAAVVLLLAGGGFVPPANAAAEPVAGVLPQGEPGPTIRLDYGHAETSGNPVAAFMYFVPLISPEPVTVETSAGSTQSARLTSATRHQGAGSFTTACDFEFTGDGSQQNVFDLGPQMQRHARQLKAGETLGRQLRSITVTGAGRGRVEVEGTVADGVQTVTEVRLRFNTQGQTSPVSIGLCDVRYQDGEFRLASEIVARVNTLTFRRKPGTPKMEVTVASVKNKGAGNGLWQNFKGSLKGAAVNLLIDPLPVEALGHKTMLEFGQALTSGAHTFTFPRAKNLKPSTAEASGKE